MTVIDVIIILAHKLENREVDGSINWNFVSGDLHIDFPELVEGLTAEQEDDLLNHVATHVEF